LGSNYSNIKIVQLASVPVLDISGITKPLGIVIAGALLLGIGLALLSEFVFDQTVRRPLEFRSHLNLPLFGTIPDLNPSLRKRNAKRHLATAGSANNAVVTESGISEASIHANGTGAELDSYLAGLRDRTVMYLERMTHKPKLIAVTACNAGAGVTTIATGLVKALSETAEGRVLLVDMTSESGATHPFLDGIPGCHLTDILEQEKPAAVHENLYVAKAGERKDGQFAIIPKRFASLIPKLKASDYDYVVFDMPPVNQNSITPRLAGLMDLVLLVLESEKTQRSLIQHSNSVLFEAKANVRGVLNKQRCYVPHWLCQEF